ncbi:MAG: ATP-dependent helicase Lhr and Lhr-like helicase [Candidatus Methanomethylophilaceae archaeon]|nr:ATP-dependent helicase Lhr and Lhr-like helicase [Candidatus Methanomethylophilaceae archaeon]
MNRADIKHSKEEVMALMEPLVSMWFQEHFEDLSDPQSRAIPVIHERRNVLVSSPTGSGKTLTAFLSIINELTRYASEGRLEDRVYCVYVSPLKALANDINRNLNQPLEEMREVAERHGLGFPGIRVAVRSGDTSQYERQKMTRKPPHILITTPESLALVLNAPKFRQSLAQMEWLIVDEIHDICDSKRGAFLSLTMERLQDFCENKFTRIGLSATLAPIEDIAAFLVGNEEGQMRDVTLVEANIRKDLDLKVICPSEDIGAQSYEISNAQMYDMLLELVEQHSTTLIFTNTRSGAESVVYKLRERGLESIEAHHSSLSKEIRLDVEEKLKRGELKCVVSSTSLELGIDIGSVDLVCQIGSPKSVAKGLQRIGRSGHGMGQTSKGRLLVFDQDDLVECAVLCRAAHRGNIDRVSIPHNCLDVLAQCLVGMSLEQRWNLDDALAVVRRSYCFQNLSEEKMLSVLRYLGSRDEYEGVYGKLWFDEEERRFGRRRGSRMIYYLNLGTIPEESNFRVLNEHGAPVGELSEKFVERLSAGDIFVLGGRSFEFVRAKGMRVYVKEAHGRKPTVPSWTGETLPRSFDLSMEVAKFRGEMAARLDEDDEALTEWLMADFDIDYQSARSVISYFREQALTAGIIPDAEHLLVEEYIDPSNNHNLIFHFPFGRRVNDALSRAYAHRISSQYQCNVSVSINDDTFMISAPRKLDLHSVPSLLRSDELETVLRKAVKDSELFKQRFRHTAARSFMILRNYRGRQVSVSRQQTRSSYLLETLAGIEGMPVIEETYREILEDDMDLHNARAVLRMIEEGKMAVISIPYSGTPSPFAHNAILSGYSDIVLMEDRSALLRELHRKVLSRAMGPAVREFEFEEGDVVPYFREKIGEASDADGLLSLLRRAGPLRIFRERGRNVYPYARAERSEVDTWARQLLREGRIASVLLDDLYFVAAEERPYYAAATRRERELNDLDKRVLELLDEERSLEDLSELLSESGERVLRSLRKLESMYLIGRSDIRRNRWYFHRIEAELPDRQEALDRVVQRYLECFAPATAEEVAYALTIDIADAQRTLDDLVKEGLLSKGKFLISEHEQYMLRMDHLRLRSGGEIFDHASVDRYRRSKTFRYRCTEEMLSSLLSVGSTLDVFHRVEGFSLDEWGRARSEGRILLGRFLKGRVRYVLREDAPMLVKAYRQDSLREDDKALLQLLEMEGGMSLRQIVAVTGKEKTEIKETLDRLDRNLYLHRRFEEREDRGSENVYVPLQTDDYEGDPWREIVARVIRGHGPIPVMGLSMMLGLPRDVLRFYAEEVGATIISVGEAHTPMLVFPEELPAIRDHRAPPEETRIVSPFDPDAQPRWAEINARYGDRFVYPVLRGASLLGAMEIWEMSGALEVRSVDLEDPYYLHEALEALDRAMGYFGQRGYDLIRLREVLGEEPEKLSTDLMDTMLAHGYLPVNGFLAKGRFIPFSMEWEEMLSLILWYQHIPRERHFVTLSEAVSVMGSIRSDAELMARVREVTSVKRGMDKRYLLSMTVIPPYVAYTTREHAAIFRAARNAEIDDDMRMLISVIKDHQPITRRDIFLYSTLGELRSSEALRRLRQGSIVYTDAENRYNLVPLREIPVEDARDKVVRMMFSNFGIFSAEQLSQMMGPNIPMHSVRASLTRLENEGYLVKGFFLEGSPTVYWMLAEAADRPVPPFRDQAVIGTQDNLHVYLRHIRNRGFETDENIILDGPEIIGGFKGKIADDRLIVKEIRGGEGAWKILRDFVRSRRLLVEGPTEQEDEDWDVWEFYRKTHPGER